MNRYAYHRPRTLDEAFRVLADSPGAKFVAGGTDLLVQMKKRRDPGPPALISLRGIEELRRIDAGKSIRIGACAPLDEVARHPIVRGWFPALARSIDRRSGSPVSLWRNRYIQLVPKAMPNAAYPIKQVITWAINQLLFRAGING